MTFDNFSILDLSNINLIILIIFPNIKKFLPILIKLIDVNFYKFYFVVQITLLLLNLVLILG